MMGTSARTSHTSSLAGGGPGGGAGGGGAGGGSVNSTPKIFSPRFSSTSSISSPRPLLVQKGPGRGPGDTHNITNNVSSPSPSISTSKSGETGNSANRIRSHSLFSFLVPSVITSPGGAGGGGTSGGGGDGSGSSNTKLPSLLPKGHL